MADTAPRLKFLDTALYAIVMNIGLRWLPVAAAVGPAAFPMWILALVTFYVPLACASAELTTRFSGEGGIYSWVRETYGPLAGFLCGWFYWFALMPFFAGILYFLVGLIATAFGADTHNTSLNLALSLGIGILIVAFQTVGLRYGKWLTNFGAACSWLIFLVIAGVALMLVFRGHSATHFAAGPFLPAMNFDSAILWGSIVFAYSGVEGIAFVRNDIQGGMRTVVRVVAILGAAMALIYIAGTAAMLVILPQSELTRLAGFPDVLHATFAKAGAPGLAGIAMGLLALAQLGGLTAWFVAGAKLPMSAGLDNFLPAVFARKNEKTGVPVAATWLQGGLMLFMVVLGEAGSSAATAYDFLVSMSVITNSIAYVFLFAVYLKRAREAPMPGVWRTPGGAVASIVLGLVGLVMTVIAIVCSAIPSDGDPHPGATLLKIVLSTLAMLVVGLAFYWLADRRRRSAEMAVPNG
jgi:glutamate:GABA antiporter